MSTGKIVLLFTIVFNVSVPCFGAGLFLMPTTFWNSAPRSNQITQDSAQEETKVPESIEAQIEEPIAYELKMAKPLEGHLSFRWAPQRKFTQSDLMKMLKLQKATLPRLDKEDNVFDASKIKISPLGMFTDTLRMNEATRRFRRNHNL